VLKKKADKSTVDTKLSNDPQLIQIPFRERDLRRASTILRQRFDQFKQPTSPSFQAG
jgi:hypothetical protein